MKKGGIVGLVRVMLLVSTIVIAIGAAPILLRLPIAAEAKVSMTLMYSGPRASMAVSGNNNIYLTWWDNKTGNNEVYFGGSNDGGKTFGSPINISNSPDARS